MSLDAIEEVVAGLAKLEAQAVLMFKDALAEFAAEFFESNPNVEKFGWMQYTPYFNDGDPCYFRVSEVMFCLFGQDYADDGMWGWEWASDNSDLFRLENLLNSLPQAVLTNSFGEHAEVVVSRDGVKWEYYEHD